jgi:DUF3037 family protein
VPALCSYDYAVIRVVPRVDREEFVNVGVILSCATHDFLEARIAVDKQRLLALDSTLDEATLQRHLDSILVICRGGPEAFALGALTPRERFHWLVAPRSTVIQTSPAHSGTCEDPGETLDSLMRSMVLPTTTKR